MKKLKTVGELLNGQKIVPVVVIEDEPQALGLANALLAGGVSVIEITLRSKFGLDAIALVKQECPQMLVLAGTVNSKSDMRAAVAAGADGIISPGLTKSLARTARKLKIPYLPGVATASDILRAMNYGITECKLFPATVVGGVSALKAFAGPFPDMKFCPTGGVSKDNAAEFLALSNVMCVGGSWLAPGDMVKAHDWNGISNNCQHSLD